jgi:anthranilate phosphoribosyltransferase
MEIINEQPIEEGYDEINNLQGNTPKEKLENLKKIIKSQRKFEKEDPTTINSRIDLVLAGEYDINILPESLRGIVEQIKNELKNTDPNYVELNNLQGNTPKEKLENLKKIIKSQRKFEKEDPTTINSRIDLVLAGEYDINILPESLRGIVEQIKNELKN